MYFFRFDVHTSEKDYIDYNLFWTLQSPYGRKQIRDVRIFLTFLAFAGVLVSLFRGNFTTAAFLGAILYLIILLLSQIFLTKAMPWAIKSQIKGLKKKREDGVFAGRRHGIFRRRVYGNHARQQNASILP